MTMLAGEIRRGRGRGRTRRIEPSVREVCLLRPADPEPAAWKPGSEVEWVGRLYRIEAAEAHPGPGPAPDGPPRYVHLAPIRPNP